MSGKPPAGDRGGVISNSGFVKPNVPPVNQQNKRRKNDVDQMGTISETSQNADTTELPDPMALNKDGYVDKNLVKPSQNNLSHFSWMCPGLNGIDSTQDISRSTFNQLLVEHPRFTIPIFQRRYCWKKEQVERWYNDTRRGTRDPMGSHNTGNLIITRSSLSSDSYLLIDGQQRVTTTLIFLAAIRDTLKSLQISHNKIQDDRNNLLARINSFLFVNGDPKEPKLTPCYLDRKSFFGIVISDEKIFLSEAGNDSSTLDTESFQAKAYRLFIQCMKEEMDQLSLQDECGLYDLLEEVARQALDLMSVTRCKIEGNIDPAQVFLWLQEKSFFNGYQLQNLRPGEFLSTLDMARNLLLAPLLKISPQLQDKIYLEHWVFRLEKLFPSQEELDTAVIKYITYMKDEEVKTTSEFEKMFTKMHKQLSGGNRFDGLLHYSKFVSIFEHIQEKVASGKLNLGEAGSDLDFNDQNEAISSDLKSSLCVIDSLEAFFAGSNQ